MYAAVHGNLLWNGYASVFTQICHAATAPENAMIKSEKLKLDLYTVLNLSGVAEQVDRGLPFLLLNIK